MAPRPYSEKSSLPTDSSNDDTSGIPVQNLPETPSPSTFSETTTPSPTLQEEVPIEPYIDSHESNRVADFVGTTPYYPTPGDIMPYDHSLPDFIRQITNQSNLANLHSLSLRVISTVISLHRMSMYLPNLRYLDLEGSFLNSLRDIGCSLKNLQILKVGRCQLESLDGTFGLSSLRELYAQKNFINDVSPCSNLPHIRHIDVSGYFSFLSQFLRFNEMLIQNSFPKFRNRIVKGNRIRNISYAGFLSVCSKLKSIIFTGNPATEVFDYRKHVRRILPQVEILDGVPFSNEGENILENTEEVNEPETTENYSDGSGSSSAEVPDFSSVSPSESMNNFFESEEDLFILDKKYKHAKNLSNQDQSEGDEVDFQEVSTEIKSNLGIQDDFYIDTPSMLKKEHPEQMKVTENRNEDPKQKCASILKLDKDNENRSKKTNLLTNEADVSSKIPNCIVLEKNNDDETKAFSMENSLTKSPILNSSDEILEESSKSGKVDQNREPIKLTTGLPVCGNLTLALRCRKKIQNARDEKQQYQKILLAQKVPTSVEEDEIKKLQVQINGSGDCFDAEPGVDGANENDLIGEDVVSTSKKWREAFRRFRSNNRAQWEEEFESDFTTDTHPI